MEKATSKRSQPKLAAWLVAIVLAVGAATWFGFQPSRAGTVWVFILVGVPTVALAALGAWRSDAWRDWLKPSWGDVTRGFACGALLFAFAVMGAKLFFAAGTPRELWLEELYRQFGARPEHEPSALRIALVLVVVATAEELLWRGFVTSLIAERTGPRTAWVYAAALYAVAHLPAMAALAVEGAWNPVLPLAALGCGLAWGTMARYFGRLFPGIVSHVLFDWAVLMMFPLYSPPS